MVIVVGGSSTADIGVSLGLGVPTELEAPGVSPGVGVPAGRYVPGLSAGGGTLGGVRGGGTGGVLRVPQLHGGTLYLCPLGKVQAFLTPLWWKHFGQSKPHLVVMAANPLDLGA